LILSGTVVNIGVSMNPGRIALQRILYLLMQMLLIEIIKNEVKLKKNTNLANSFEALRVNASTPAFEAA